MRLSDPTAWHFDIDEYLNRIIPPPPWRRLPYSISYFLGYRRRPTRDIGNLIIIFWACTGVFCGLVVVESVSKSVPSFQEHNAPIIIASFGAAAVLQFYAIESPLAQPRNAILGQMISSVIGVGFCKLFALSPHFESIRWLGGALACAVATAVMALTKTVHPPGGSTALLAVVSNDALGLGWWLLPVMLLGCVFMVAIALVINNIQRKYPQHWWTSEKLVRIKPHAPDAEMGADLESKLTTTSSSVSDPTKNDPQLVIRRGHVDVPDHMYLTPEEKDFLEELSDRI